MKPYIPPACSFTDHLEAAAVLQQVSHIIYLDNANKQQEIQAKIIDIYATDGADWCKLDNGSIIRLDHIEQFNDIKNEGTCEI
ncbi:MAG: hypothetical protein F6K11_00170 [Leptolyngbya sp. SIO3F4]|nr:hypothetical protein [Leptolyngbya sp. SIO3F4]